MLPCRWMIDTTLPPAVHKYSIQVWQFIRQKINDQNVGQTIATQTNFTFLKKYFVHKFTHSQFNVKLILSNYLFNHFVWGNVDPGQAAS